MATFMAAVESTIVATAMPTIVADLGGFRLFSWVFAAYLLTMAVSTPIYGRLADLYGRKRVFFAGAAIFLVGTTLCGFAPTMAALVFFRALQGLGAGAIQPIASTIVGDIYTPAERARVQGYVSSTFGISAIVGPALGAFIVEDLHWSLVFWVNLPIGAASILMYALFLRERVRPREHRIDLLGAILLALGVGAAMLALVQSETLGKGAGAGFALIGAAALGWLFVHERRAAEPIVPVQLWKRRVIALGNLGTFAIGAAMMGVSAFLPTFVQGAMGRSAAVAGFALGCQSVSWTLGTFATARVMIRTSYRLAAVIGGLTMLLGALLLALLEPGSGIFLAFAGSLMMGLGIGFSSPAFLVSIQASVGWEERGAATASIMFMRVLGQSLGAAIFGAIVNLGLSERLPHAGSAVNRLLEPALRRSLGAQEIARLGTAVAAAIHEVYLIIIGIAAATLLVSLFFPAGLSPIRPSGAPRRETP